MRRTTTRFGAIVSGGALVLALAACGDDSPEVEEPNNNGGNSEENNTGENNTGDEGTDETNDGADETDDGLGGEDGTEETEDGLGGEDGTEETDDGDAGGDGGGEVAAGSEVSTEDFINRLKSPGDEALSSFEMSMDMAVEGQAVNMSGVADLTADGGPAMDIQMEVPGMGSIHMIMVDGAAYMAMPGLTEDGQFIEMPLEEVMGDEAEDFTNQVDMTSQWDDWENGAQSITLVGQEDVNGEQMDHYQLVLDTSQLETAEPGMPGELTYDVWVDSSDFMRMVTFEIEGSEVEMTMDNWGEPVNVEAPDASQLTEMPGMGTEGP